MMTRHSFGEAMMRRERPLQWNRDGIPYPRGTAGTLAWAKDFEDKDEKRVAWDESAYGEVISAIWTGIDRRFIGEGPPRGIFELGFRDCGGQWSISYFDSEAQVRAAFDSVFYQTLIPPSWRPFLLGRLLGIPLWWCEE